MEVQYLLVFPVGRVRENVGGQHRDQQPTEKMDNIVARLGLFGWLRLEWHEYGSFTRFAGNKQSLGR
jgi:hypothetical protein